MRNLDPEFCDVDLETSLDLRNASYSDATAQDEREPSDGAQLNTDTGRTDFSDEFCDVSLENSTDPRHADPSTDKTNKNSSKVRKNLRQIASKIRVGPRHAQGNATAPMSPPDPGGEDSSSQVDLPPFAAFTDPSGRESGVQGELNTGLQVPSVGTQTHKHYQQPPNSPEPGEDMGLMRKGILGPRDTTQPQQPPCRVASPPVGYSGLSSLMYEADDTAYADSDTATVGSDSGVLVAMR